MRQHRILLTTPPLFSCIFTTYPEPLYGAVHGGLLIFYRTTLDISIIYHAQTSWLPIIWIKVGDVIICAAYLPPQESTYLVHWNKEPMETLYDMVDKYGRRYPGCAMAIIGDLNARRNAPPDVRWTERGRILQHQLPEGWFIHAPKVPTPIAPREHKLTLLKLTFRSASSATSCVDYILLSNESIARGAEPDTGELPTHSLTRLTQ